MECKEFQVEPLPYPYEALEPYIDTETMTVHHDVLYQRYVDKLNAALKNYPEYQCYSLEELLLGMCYLPKEISIDVFNNAGGAFNHREFFRTMKPKPQSAPKGGLGKAIGRQYGNFAKFKEQFKAAALSVFGSGWTWLVMDHKGALEILNTANQITPLTLERHPVICIDIWEHGYFLQYLAERGAYIDGWFEVANWEEAEKNFEMMNRLFKASQK